MTKTRSSEILGGNIKIFLGKSTKSGLSGENLPFLELASL